MNKQLYPTDLTDQQWNLIKDFFPTANDFGRRREIQAGHIYNAIVYLLRTRIRVANAAEGFSKVENGASLFPHRSRKAS